MIVLKENIFFFLKSTKRFSTLNHIKLAGLYPVQADELVWMLSQFESKMTNSLTAEILFIFMRRKTLGAHIWGDKVEAASGNWTLIAWNYFRIDNTYRKKPPVRGWVGTAVATSCVWFSTPPSLFVQLCASRCEERSFQPGPRAQLYALCR